MKTVKEAVDHYLPKKTSGEMSLGEIRRELQENTEFTEVEINSICLNVSDQELAELGEKKQFSLEFLDNIYFSIFMILASIAIFIFSFMRFNYLVRLSEFEEVADADYFVPGTFMVVSTMFLIRHVVRIFKKSKSS